MGAPPINQNKKVSKDNFPTISLVRTVCELTFSIIQTHNKTGTLGHSDAFILFTSAKIVADQRPQNTFSKSNAPCMLTRPFLNGCDLVGACFLGFLHSSSSLSVSCSHLSPTALTSNPPYRKRANFRKALNAKFMFFGLQNFFDQAGPAIYFIPGNGLKYANVRIWRNMHIHPYCRPISIKTRSNTNG